MQLAYVFCWVDDVRAEARFHEQAFDLRTRLLEEVPGHGWRAELETGQTTLYLADSRELGQPGEIPADAYPNDATRPPAAFQLTLIDDDVPGAYARAVRAGASTVAEPYRAPWGQTLARLRTGGVVVSLASPVQPQP